MTMTVGDLLALLEDYDLDTEVRLATQPSWPFEYGIGDIASVGPDEPCPSCGRGSDQGHDPDGCERDGEPWPTETVVYIAEAGQIGYLSGLAATAVGWADR